MIGLIKKDLLLLKSQLKSYLLIIIVFTLVSFASNDNSFISLLPIFGVMLIISTLSYDNYYKWDAFALTLPISRRDTIKSKYLLSILIILVFTFIASFILIAFNLSKGIELNLYEIVSVIIGSLLGASLACSISIPLMYKFGSENGRIIMIIVVFAIGGGIAALSKVLSSYFDQSVINNTIAFISTNLLPIMSILMVIFLICSYFITLKIYMKKEF